MEKRKNTRLQLRLLGQMSLDGIEYRETETRNIGLHGALLRHDFTGCLNKHCILNLFTSGTNVFSITIHGWTVYEGPDGCGMKFLSMNTADAFGLTEFLARQVENSQAIHHELEQGRHPLLTNWNPLRLHNVLGPSPQH